MNKASIFVIALAAIAFASVSRADDPPKFSAPEVNEFVKTQTALMDDYIAAVKEGDDAKKEAAVKKMGENSDKNMFTVYEKLTAAEKPVYDKWQKDETERMSKALQEK
jgi:hypothetical protein